MPNSFILSCESTVDLPFSYISSRNIPVLFYSYTVDDKEYTDDMGRDPEALGNFYKFIADGKIPRTTQLNTFHYLDFLRPLLEKGDVLHIAFGSGMTNSCSLLPVFIGGFREAAEKGETVKVIFQEVDDLPYHVQRPRHQSRRFYFI